MDYCWFYNGNVMVSINDSGEGVVGLIGLFDGCDPENATGSPYTTGCYHQPIFKVTDDNGRTWKGNNSICGSDGEGVYHIPDNVFADMIASFPQPDPETGLALEFECSESNVTVFDDFWSYYEYDFKVDRDGNVHILMNVLPGGVDNYDGEEGNWFADGAGWYHFTIDRDNLDNPGPVNSETGWNWSYVVDAQDTMYWNDNQGEAYLYDMMASLSFGRDEEDADVVWVVLNLMSDHCGELFDDYGTEDPCDDTYSYPDTSLDIYVVKSEDDGKTWYNPYNATATKDDPAEYPASWNGECPADNLIWCGPEETFPHAAHYGSGDEVYYAFQMPNYGWIDGGSTFYNYDFMNRVYVAKTEVTANPAEAYPPDCSILCNDPGDIQDDGDVNIFDIIFLVNHIFGISVLDPVVDEAAFCAADMNDDGSIDVSDIIPIVNIILAGDGRLDDAYNVDFYKTDNGLEMSANGFVSVVEVIVNHPEGLDENSFKFNNDNSEIAMSSVKGTQTTVILVMPRNGVLFEVDSEEFSIESVSAYNSSREANSVIADHFALMDAYPNPFNPSTTIKYQLPAAGEVKLVIYNLLGQEVRTLVQESMDAGFHSVVWDGMDEAGKQVASGIYIYRLSATDFNQTRRMMLLK